MRPSGGAWKYVSNWTMTSSNLSNDVTSNTFLFIFKHRFDITLHSMAYKFSLGCYDR